MDKLPPLIITISREVGLSFCTFALADGQTLELEPDEARAWCIQRGANPDDVENVLDYVWNFRIAKFVIKEPKVPQERHTHIDPLL